MAEGKGLTKTVLSLAGAGIIAALCGWFVTTFFDMQKEIEVLKQENSHWGSLADQQEQIIENRIQVEVLNRLRREDILRGTHMHPDRLKELEDLSKEFPLPVRAPRIDVEKYMEQQMKRFPSKK